MTLMSEHMTPEHRAEAIARSGAVSLSVGEKPYFVHAIAAAIRDAESAAIERCAHYVEHYNDNRYGDPDQPPTEIASGIRHLKRDE